jgi:hypothetical protein
MSLGGVDVAFISGSVLCHLANDVAELPPVRRFKRSAAVLAVADFDFRSDHFRIASRYFANVASFPCCL